MKDKIKNWIENGLFTWTTFIGASVIIFVLYNHNELKGIGIQLIKSITTHPDFIEKTIEFIVGIIVIKKLNNR